MMESFEGQKANGEQEKEKGVIGQFMDMAREELEPLHALNPSVKEKKELLKDELGLPNELEREDVTFSSNNQAPTEENEFGVGGVNLNSLKSFLSSILSGELSTEKIDEQCKEYFTAHRKDDLAAFIYNDLKDIYGNDPDMLEQILAFLEQIFAMSKEDIILRAQYVKENNIKTGQMSIEDNHRFIEDVMTMLLSRLNSNEIDYYLTGSLPCYMLTGIKDESYHDDVDFMLNESEIEKVRALLEGTEFDFKDDRLTTKKVIGQNGLPMGDNELVARHSKIPFHINFTPFERGLDREVISKEYFKDNMGSLKVYKHMISPELSQMLYDDKAHFYGNTGYRMASLENIYNAKQSSMSLPGRERDRKDARVILQSGRLNPEKLQAIKSAPQLDPVIEPVSLSKGYDNNSNGKPFYMKNSNIPFDQRSNEEIQIADSIREKNQAIGQKKREQQLAQKPKVLTLQRVKNTPLGQRRGAVDITILIISTISVATVFTMLLEFLTR